MKKSRKPRLCTFYAECTTREQIRVQRLDHGLFPINVKTISPEIQVTIVTIVNILLFILNYSMHESGRFKHSYWRIL